MQNYAALRKQKKNPLITAIALLVCVALSGAMLTSRLIGFNTRHQMTYIPLTQSNGATQVTAIPKESVQIAPSVQLLSAVPLTQVEEEEDTVWMAITGFELFNISYKNGVGEVTVQSSRGDNVVAPGTSNVCTFALQNTSDMGLDYDIEVEAYFTVDGGDEKVPIQIRLWDSRGNYLIGGQEWMEDLSDVNVASGSGSISAGYIMPYTIEWLWPFEGDDALDTWLGNYSTETGTDVSLVIEIRTIAEQGGEGGEPPPSTGDNTAMVLSGMVFVGSTFGLLIMLLPKRKREEKDD